MTDIITTAESYPGRVVALEFSNGEPRECVECSDAGGCCECCDSDNPRPDGTYMIVRVDDDTARLHAGRVLVIYDGDQPTEPARCAPSRDEIAEAICRVNDGEAYVEVGPCSACESAADAVLALFAEAPTVEQGKAEAWSEGFKAGLRPDSWQAYNPYDPASFAAAQPTPVFEAMGLPTPEVPSVFVEILPGNGFPARPTRARTDRHRPYLHPGRACGDGVCNEDCPNRRENSDA
ncbi:hypothetical protein ATK74_1786 [Propionicimonas paludicola]|uniref:Uncharacterized protein n=1 Tax=Propionicimonas paludicola TaxID=185243 RepID=A0A2A9CS18_9ACTN|nr:hypothetical protein [Propionicimonas paludicola]PFG17223.1 hypothetical protein ATK74_1786 [Propionicimonas paludicola]